MPMEERVRPDERRRYVFLLWFNVSLGVLWAVLLVLTGQWWFAGLLAACLVLGGLSAWALSVLNREGIR
ncbi:hypothetical protein WCD74_10075 [Actinomycetospora sp. OC33-EN08]|uniref:Uncharacterized protein n=1 Tax=Actinomycetospora aurantiaca TaxID=3129233 RepID=A0ABU8MLC8_9PSEU